MTSAPYSRKSIKRGVCHCSWSSPRQDKVKDSMVQGCYWSTESGMREPVMSYLREAMVASFEDGFKPRKGQSDLKGEVSRDHEKVDTDPRKMLSGKGHYPLHHDRHMQARPK